MKRYLNSLRARSIALSTKILVLIVGAVVVSMSLAGWMIYNSQADQAYERTFESMLQVASTASVYFEAPALASITSPADRNKPAYRTAKGLLAKIWKQNHYDLQDKWGRISLQRLNVANGELSYVISLEGDDLIGRKAPSASRVYQAAVRGESVAQDFDEGKDSWLRVYAPLRSNLTGDRDDRFVVCVESSATRLQMDLLKIIGQIVLAAAAGLVIALLGGWALSLQITKPMRAFVDVMKLMQSTGDFNLRIDLHPEDRDLSVVEETFSSLIAKVRDSREKEESSYWSTLQALVTALDVRDNETAGHSVRVTRYSLAIAERMRVAPALLEQVRQGALLHDIGKIGVPDAILRKQGKLTEAEYKEMQKHPTIGKTFLEDIEFLRPATAVVYCHHERWDGTGYPNGLQGEAIPLAARIFAVADALDVITSERYYKKASSYREAREEIERCSGSHFDPQVVKAFLTLPEKSLLRVRLDTNMAVMHLEKTKRRYG